MFDDDVCFAEETRTVQFIDRRRKVLLSCNGEPHDFRFIRVLAVTVAAKDVEVVNFVCPRCHEEHESLLFC
jgi:hypothetical protein